MPGFIKKNITLKWLIAITAIFFISAAIPALSYFIFTKIYENKIYPGVYAGQFNVGGYTADQAKKILNQKMDQINQNGIKFFYKKNQAVLIPLVASVESDLAYRTIGFNTNQAVDQAFNFGRQRDFYNNLREKTKALIFGQKFFIPFTINIDEINDFLRHNFSPLENPAQNAKLFYKINKYSKVINFGIKEEKLGQVIDYQKGIRQLNFNLAELNNNPIYLTSRTDYPQISKIDCLNAENTAKKIIQRSPLFLGYQKNRWLVNRKILAGWLTIKKNPYEKCLEGENDSCPAGRETLSNSQTDTELPKQNKPNIFNKFIVGLNYPTVTQFLDNVIAPEINRQPIEAKFTIKNGRVIEFQNSRDGLELNAANTAKNIEYELLVNKNTRIKLITRELKSVLRTKDINNIGIEEIIGTGESNFTGSPKNRRHNIKTGADTLNGLLIKPQEEFSLNKALGKINAQTGYLPELVIKDNRTIPEYGGGLCQIGTTIFRAALASGLPITMRRNHSYRVSYYEPAGTDATIYTPWPDLKFVNDTGHHILIQSRIENNNLYFDFWGTKDGRIVEKTEPTIYNITKPGPTKYIETTNLPPGKKKCTEHAHNGADAYFDYKVTYPNGEIKEKKFHSHYTPWREVCLIGIKNPPNGETATSSEKNIQ